jgi:cytidylate kinase
MITKADKKRASFYNFQTEKKWGHASSYNLTVDTGALGIDGCVTLIRRYLELKNSR